MLPGINAGGYSIVRQQVPWFKQKIKHRLLLLAAFHEKGLSRTAVGKASERNFLGAAARPEATKPKSGNPSEQRGKTKASIENTCQRGDLCYCSVGVSGGPQAPPGSLFVVLVTFFHIQTIFTENKNGPCGPYEHILQDGS